MTSEDIIIQYALSFVGTNYRWGGDDPMAGWDCSGLVQEILVAAGEYPSKEDRTAQDIFRYYTHLGKISIQAPCFGALAFYGKDIQHISHVAFCLSAEFMIEAGGGNSKVLTKTDAEEANAFVRLRPVRYRKDLLTLLKIIV